MTAPVVAPAPTRCPFGHAHPTYKALAECIWSPKLIGGEGPYAMVATCFGYAAVALWMFIDDALDAKNEFDLHIECANSRHQLHRLVLPQPAEAAR